MSQKTLRTAVGILMATLLFLGCAKKASDEIDFGTLKDSVYTNSFFKFSITFPTSWYAQDQKAQQRLIKKGTKLVAGDNDELKGIIKASELQTVNLFAVFEHPIGAPVEYNPSILSVAESISEYPGIERGKDYLFQARKLLEASAMNITFSNNYATEKIGGLDFDVMDLQISALGKTIKQKYYAAIIKGYAFSIIISFTNEEEAAKLQKILETVKFN